MGAAGAACPCPQVDMVGRGGERIPVSVWMKRVKQERLCCVVVLEPVERVSAWVSFQSNVSLLGFSARVGLCISSPVCQGLYPPPHHVPLRSVGSAPIC